MLAGKYRLASEEEKMLVRIGALENIVHSCKETLAGIVSQKAVRLSVQAVFKDASWTAGQPRYTHKNMLHNVTITVDDTIHQILKPMVEQQTIGAFLSDILQYRSRERQTYVSTASSIRALRGTLYHADASDLREESGRPL